MLIIIGTNKIDHPNAKKTLNYCQANRNQESNLQDPGVDLGGFVMGKLPLRSIIR
jgi:hypothetical protein